MTTIPRVEGVRHHEAIRPDPKERKKLLDKLVEYGEKIGRLSSEDARWRSHLITIDAHLKSVTRVERSEQQVRRHLRLERMDVLAFKKRIAKQILETRNGISWTKRRLEE